MAASMVTVHTSWEAECGNRGEAILGVKATLGSGPRAHVKEGENSQRNERWKFLEK